MITKRQRVEAAIRGEVLDRVPFTFWYHFHLNPPTGEGMAAAEVKFLRDYEPDIYKLMHDVPYEESEVVESIDDWVNLRTLQGQSGNFGAQADTIRLILKQVEDDDAPVITTVFNTFRYANQISGGKLMEHLRQDPERVHIGLRGVADSLINFVTELMTTDLDGIYFAIFGASSDQATPMEYVGNFMDYDREVLEAAHRGTLNIIHPHSYEEIYFDSILELPGQVYCWSDRAAGPSLAEMRTHFDGALMGGIDETKIATMSPEEIRAQGRESIEAMQGTPFILAPGCSVPDGLDPDLGRAIRPEV